jgi:N-acetylmuramoyl-L-alanine amidase
MKRFTLILCLTLLASCARTPAIDDSYPSLNQDSRVRFIVLHYTSTDLANSLALLTHGDVSSHYLIADDQAGTIYRLVEESRRAWHAGESEWKGRTWLNATSIGIELVNPGYLDTPNGRVYQPYGEAQIESLIALLKDIVARHELPPGSVIGHNDIAPQRKVDPGPMLPWKRLADAGLLPWPDARQVLQQQQVFANNGLPNALWFQQQLVHLGYPLVPSGLFDEATRNVLTAFQMKYRPRVYDGQADAETAALLQVLNASGN